MGSEGWIEVERKKQWFLVQPGVDNCLSMTGRRGREKKGR